MSANGFQVRRVGVFPGPQAGSATGAAAQSLGQMIRLLDALVGRKAISLETVTLESPPVDRSEFSGFLLGAGVMAQSWLRGMGGTVVVLAPCQLKRGAGGLIIWPFEDSTRMRTARGGVAEAWVETTTLTKAGVEAAARSALAVARERGFPTPLWAYAGWGETEDFALGVAARMGGPETVAAVSLEDVVARLQGSAEGDFIVVSLGRAALPLARILGAQGWVAYSELSGPICQASGTMGAVFSLAWFLDRLGLLNEARELERLAREAYRQNPESPPADLFARILERV